VVDFGAVNQAVLNTFGDQAQLGTTGTYTPKGGQPFGLDGVFDEAWKEVGFHTSRHSVSLPVSTTKPMLGCRKIAFPVNVTPAQGDTYVRTVPLLNEDGSQQTDENGNPLYQETTYVVADVRSDGVSDWLQLILN